MISLRCLVLPLLVGFWLATGAWSAPQFYPSHCEQVCSDPSDFIQGLPANAQSSGSKPIQWGAVGIVQAKDNLQRLSPPGVARSLGLLSACMYDTAVLFDYYMQPYAAQGLNRVGCTSPDQLGPAIDGAAYTALSYAFRSFSSVGKVKDALYQIGDADTSVLEAFLSNDLSRSSRGVATTALNSQGNVQLSDSIAMQVGRLVCEKVIEKFTADGYDGVGEPLADGYTPVNLPQSKAGVTDCAAEVKDLNRWQPVCTPRDANAHANVGTTNCNVQEFLAPKAGAWTSFAIPHGEPTDGKVLMDAVAGYYEDVKGYPPRFGEGSEWRDQMLEMVEASGNLGDKEKLIAEYWADGPDFASPPGTWFRITMNAAIWRGMDTMEASKLLFLAGMAVNDAGVASWRVKRTFDSARPLQMVQCGFSEPGKQISAWKGPYQGVGYIPAALWQPYQEDTFKTPPFPGYVSGHSAFSAAVGQVLSFYFGSDDYVGPRCKMFREGDSFFERKITEGQEGYKPGYTDVPNTGKDSVGYAPRSDLTLCWDQFSGAFTQSGESRIYGGIHIQADNIDGTALGREVGKATYKKAMQLFGTTVDMYSVF